MATSERHQPSLEEQPDIPAGGAEEEEEEEVYKPSPALESLPEIPADTGFDLSSILGSSGSAADQDKFNKRASNVQKLAQENERLKDQLREMTERLEAAERRRKQLAEKEQKVMEEPSS